MRLNDIVICFISCMVGYAAGCMTMLRNFQKYPDRYHVQDDKSEVQDDAGQC